MKPDKLGRIVAKNMRRNMGHLALSAIGIVAGIAAFSFFLALGVGVKHWVHGDNFLPLTKLEIIPPKKSLEEDPSKLKNPITDELVARIRARKDVRDAYPKMRFAFPGMAHGGRSLFGHDIHIEFLGDGIDPKLVGNVKLICGSNQKDCSFRDWWAQEQPKTQCSTDKDCPAGKPCLAATHSCAECAEDADCGRGNLCDPLARICIPRLQCWPGDPLVYDQQHKPVKDEFGRTKRKNGHKNADCWQASGRYRCDGTRGLCTPTCRYHDDCGPGYYCDKDITHTCYRAVPALVSQYIIEMYNGSVAPGRGWTRIDKSTIDQFLGMTFTANLGQSIIGNAATNVRPLERRVQLVAVSDKAIPLGVTVPIGYVKRWNRYFARKAPDGTALEAYKYKHYTSVVVWLKSKSYVSSFAHYIKKLGYELEDNNAETVGLLITIVTLLLSVVSGFIVLISAINISHTYYMLISERRWEIGVMRAVGATRWDIRSIILGEAAVLGFFSGAVGIVTAIGLSRLVDFINVRWVPYFPFKPDSYFRYPFWLLALALGFATAFCVAGAYWPANRAAKMDPARTLTAH